jgi:RsiW-degrading membrane proteinase PrsW (M82 family)
MSFYETYALSNIITGGIIAFVALYILMSILGSDSGFFSKMFWLLFIVFVPVFGLLCWLLFGPRKAKTPRTP